MFKKFNIFTFLMSALVFTFVLRLANLASLPMRASEAEDAATPPAKFEQVQPATPATAKEAASAPAEPLKMAENTVKDPAKEATGEPAKDAAKETAPPPMSAAPPPEQDFSAPEVEVLQSLAKRREELDKREQAIGQREALLKAAGGEVDRKIAELNKLKGELEDLLNKQKGAEDERITSLVKIYENMKPKDAANIFNTLDMNVLLPVVSRMSERKTSPILAAMDPEKARQLTIKIAEQKKLPTAETPKDKAAGKPATTPSPLAATPAPTAPAAKQ